MKSKNTPSITLPVTLVLSIALVGCQPKPALPPPVTAARDACADYVSLTASLGEATVNCTGTIGPDSFFVNDKGLLQNRFERCTAGLDVDRLANFDAVQRLLRFQSFGEALPKLRECLTDRHKRWSEIFARTQLKTCPIWTPKVVVGDPARQGVDLARAAARQHGKMQPKFRYVPALPPGTPPGTPFFAGAPDQKGRQRSDLRGPTPDVGPSPDQRYADIRVPTKSVTVYEIAFNAPEAACEDPAVCAAQCAAFLPGFVVAAAGNQVVADPAQWYRNRMWAQGCTVEPHDDPWCPPDYAHQMSVNATTEGGTVPPGDSYGHPNRGLFGEHCLKWFPGTNGDPGYDYETDLVLECMDPSKTDCLSRCGN